jgi:hypothetical protein
MLHSLKTAFFFFLYLVSNREWNNELTKIKAKDLNSVVILNIHAPVLFMLCVWLDRELMMSLVT